MAEVVIRSAACDADVGAKLALTLRDRGLDAYFFQNTGDGAWEREGAVRRVVVVLWSTAARQTGEDLLLEATVDALCQDELVLATLDDLGAPGHTCLPQGFRDFTPVDLSRWHDAGAMGPVKDLEKACRDLLAVVPFAAPAPVRRMTRRAEAWNKVAVFMGGASSLIAMAAIAASGILGENAGTWDWAELILAQGVAGWVPVFFALGIATLAGLAGWFLALCLFAAAGLLSVRQPGPVEQATSERPRVALIHAPENSCEADVFAMDLEAYGLAVADDPARGEQNPAWASLGVQALRRADLVIVLGTTQAFRSERVRRDVLSAAYSDKPILPLLLERVEVPRDLRQWLGGRTWITPPDRLSGLLGPSVRSAIDDLVVGPRAVAAWS